MFIKFLAVLFIVSVLAMDVLLWSGFSLRELDHPLDGNKMSVAIVSQDPNASVAYSGKPITAKSTYCSSKDVTTKIDASFVRVDQVNGILAVPYLSLGAQREKGCHTNEVVLGLPATVTPGEWVLAVREAVDGNNQVVNYASAPFEVRVP